MEAPRNTSVPRLVTKHTPPSTGTKYTSLLSRGVVIALPAAAGAAPLPRRRASASGRTGAAGVRDAQPGLDRAAPAARDQLVNHPAAAAAPARRGDLGHRVAAGQRLDRHAAVLELEDVDRERVEVVRERLRHPYLPSARDPHGRRANRRGNGR